MQIAIVGAGILGLYLASKLAKNHKVFLFEKKAKIGGKACSGLYSERIFDFLPQAKKFIKNKIEFCLINFPKTQIKIDFKKSFFVFDRNSLEKYLFDLSKRLGVIFEFKKNVDFEFLRELEKKFDKIIGCDGAKSSVREFLKIKRPKFFLGIQGLIKKEDFSNFVEVWPTKNGFFWKIPRGKEIEYGIIEEGKLASRIFEEFQKSKKLEFFKKNLAPIPQGFFLPKNEKITLCGDSTGLTKPWSGGGVIWNFYLAEILIKNFPDFLKYKREAERFFLPQISISKFLKKLIYFFGFNFPKFLFSNFKFDGDFHSFKL